MEEQQRDKRPLNRTVLTWVVFTGIIAALFFYAVSSLASEHRSRQIYTEMMEAEHKAVESLMSNILKSNYELYAEWIANQKVTGQNPEEIKEKLLLSSIIVLDGDDIFDSTDKTPSILKERAVSVRNQLTKDRYGFFTIEGDVYVGFLHALDGMCYLGIKDSKQIKDEILPYTNTNEVYLLSRERMDQIDTKDINKVGRDPIYKWKKRQNILYSEPLATLDGTEIHLALTNEYLPSSFFSQVQLPFIIIAIIFLLIMSLMSYLFMRHFIIIPVHLLASKVSLTSLEDAESLKDGKYQVKEFHDLADTIYDMADRLLKNNQEISDASKSLYIYSEALRSTSDEIAIVDSSLLIEYVNPAFEKNLNQKNRDLKGFNFMSLIEKDQRIVSQKAVENMTYQDDWQGQLKMVNGAGDFVLNDVTISPISSKHSREIEQFVIIKRDIHERQETEYQLLQLAHYDDLTGLSNRLFFMDLLEKTIEYAPEGEMIGVLHLDLDNFKNINDSFGHLLGDELIKLVGERLSNALSENYHLARFGGDEFNILASGIQGRDEINALAEETIELFDEPFKLDNKDVYISVSVGSSVYPEDGTDMETLIKHADESMFQAKEAGRNNHVPFDPSIHDEIMRRITIEANLQDAINSDFKDLCAYYQPKIDTKTNEIIAIEALMRWFPDGDFVSPGEFIPIAENNGLIFPLTKFMFYEAFSTQVMLKEAGFDLEISVNISPAIMGNPDFLPTLRQAIRDTGINPEKVDIEITETTLMESFDQAEKIISGLQEHGIKVSVDDFGTGYSSLGYLHKFLVDRLKIDRSFVSGLPDDEDNIALIQAIVAMAKSLDILITAEGVETVEQFNFIKDEGCEEIQGFLVAKPKPAEDVLDFLIEWEENRVEDIEACLKSCNKI